ncbi:hypothetical protein LTR27_012226 [Elasticomyces elasticus]|nr:hypothetical protein LTR27_012226 [Elasticomyces elasticus]
MSGFEDSATRVFAEIVWVAPAPRPHDRMWKAGAPALRLAALISLEAQSAASSKRNLPKALQHIPTTVALRIATPLMDSRRLKEIRQINARSRSLPD